MADVYRSTRSVRASDDDCRITLGTMALALAALTMAVLVYLST